MAQHNLSISRVLDAPREKIWRCWTQPDLIKPWFCPKPWQVTEAQMDVRPGGSNYFMMVGPNGEQHPMHGVYLDVAPMQRLVFTDAFVRAWEPSEKAFMVGTIMLADAGNGKTQYDANALHWNAEDREAHEKMGFEEGWNTVATQLEQFARALA